MIADPASPGRRALRVAACLTLFLGTLGAACTPVGKGADWPPRARQWYERAEADYRGLDIEDASDAVTEALRMQPDRAEVRVLAAKIALAQLDYARTVKLLVGIESNEARALRGRALWYDGKLEQAADTLDALLADPEVRDPWARDVAKLARLGMGRKPFQLSGDLLAVMEMPKLATSALVVPIELNGEPALAMIATSNAEVVVDAPDARQPKWVSLGFDRRITVKDVPAITEDLSGLSKQLGAPIKVLLGGNVLRHLNATVDFGGSQFVVRTFTPPAPPRATNVKLLYIRGGGMALRAEVEGEASSSELAFMIDSSVPYAAVLDNAAWKAVGVDPTRMRPLPGAPQGITFEMLKNVKIGTLEIPELPGVNGVALAPLEEKLGVDLDGVVGSGLLSAFRVTLVDGGRTMWLEDHQTIEETLASPETEPIPQEPGPFTLPPPG